MEYCGWLNQIWQSCGYLAIRKSLLHRLATQQIVMRTYTRCQCLEQHGRGTAGRTAWVPSRRTHRRTSVTTNLVLDKTLALDVPMWIVTLDLSKAFDKVSDHMLWVLQCMYYGQTGRIENNSADGDLFYIWGACDKDVY